MKNCYCGADGGDKSKRGERITIRLYNYNTEENRTFCVEEEFKDPKERIN